MAKQCKFLQLDLSTQYGWHEYENELNEWINQGYEVKHIIPLNSLKSHWAKGDYDKHIYHELVDEGFLFYLERNVPYYQPKPKPKPVDVSSEDEGLPF